MWRRLELGTTRDDLRNGIEFSETAKTDLIDYWSLVRSTYGGGLIQRQWSGGGRKTETLDTREKVYSINQHHRICCCCCSCGSSRGGSGRRDPRKVSSRLSKGLWYLWTEGIHSSSLPLINFLLCCSLGVVGHLLLSSCWMTHSTRTTEDAGT